MEYGKMIALIQENTLSNTPELAAEALAKLLYSVASDELIARVAQVIINNK